MISLLLPDYIWNRRLHPNILDEDHSKEIVNFITGKDEEGDSVWRYTVKTCNMNSQDHKTSLYTPIPDHSEPASWNQTIKEY